jgi:hypothetical protein
MAGAMLRSFKFLILATGLVTLSAGLPTAASAQELLTVNGVEVDVTGDDANAARNAAFIQGQRKAFDKLIGQLADPASAASLPPLSDDQIGAMVSDFEIETEATSTVRYLGTLTFRFYADPVRQYLAGSGVRFTATQSPPIVVVPILTQGDSQLLWDDGNLWLQAWSAHGGGALVPVRVPIGDLNDIAAITVEQALAGDAGSFDVLARRYGAADTLVAEARIDPATMVAGGEAVVTVTARRYGPAGLMATFQDEVRGSADDLPALYASAVDKLDMQLEQNWKSQALTTTGSAMGNRLEVSAIVQSLDEWLEVQRRLQQVTAVQGIELKYLAVREARFDLIYAGDPLSLGRALAGRGLQLIANGTGWNLGLIGGYTGPTITTIQAPTTTVQPAPVTDPMAPVDPSTQPDTSILPPP